MVGTGCMFPQEQFFCENGGPGQLGTLLECVGDLWVKADLEKRCDFDAFCVDVGLTNPKLVGCSGTGSDVFTCVCQDELPQPCVGDEAAARRVEQNAKGWKPAEPRPRKVSPALRAYALLATSADKGAVRDLEKLAQLEKL